MATEWKSQQADGMFYLQFETDCQEKYRLVEKAAQMAMDGKTEADVVEVVRCKDCKHCWHHVPDYTYPDRTDEVWECVRTIDWVEPDHFCSRGERRTDNDV